MSQLAMPSRESLVVALEVVDKLIDFYGAHAWGISLGQEGYTGLCLTKDVIDQSILELDFRTQSGTVSHTANNHVQTDKSTTSSTKPDIRP